MIPDTGRKQRNNEKRMVEIQKQLFIYDPR